MHFVSVSRLCTGSVGVGLFGCIRDDSENETEFIKNIWLFRPWLSRRNPMSAEGHVDARSRWLMHKHRDHEKTRYVLN